MYLTIGSAMQNVENGTQPVQQHDPDEDSLFGSPPASPLLRGRSPSPELALPSANNATKNVGTIALPGSQHCSELPVNPLALSMSHGASTQPVSRPPATIRRSSTRSTSPSGSTSQVSSRASSAAPKPKARKKPAKKAVPSPRAPPPEIPLPDPSEPVPANFLRSQTALLGTAGLVAGIKPRNLAISLHSRGSKASHPIVIHDNGGKREIQKEVERPILGRKAPSLLLKASTLDLSSLPLPSNREVVALLARQRDFFITLESILKLVASGIGTSLQRSSFRSSTPAFRQTQPPQTTYSSSQPSTKRRRLDRVPAGAVDWDVPYPFAQGEGPEEYRANWERERLKQLISQLTSMIRDATRKIAMRKYLKEQEAKAAQAGQLPSQGTGDVGPNDYQQSSNVVPPSNIPLNCSNHGPLAGNEDTVNLAAQVSNSDRPAPSSSAPTTAFDQLISSLVSATPGQTSSGSTGPLSSSPSVPALSNFDFYPSAASPALSSDDFDNWLSILQTFPATDFDPNQIPNTPLSTEEDFGFIDSILDFDSSAYSNQAAGSSAEASLEQLLAQAGANPTPQSSSDNMIIDPVLLAISGPQNSSTAQTPSAFSAASPVPSTTSMGTIESMDPATPSSENWETSHPEVYTGGEDQEHSIFGRNGGGLSAQGMWGHAIQNRMRTQPVGQGVYDHQAEEIQHGGFAPPKDMLDKGKGRDISQMPTSSAGVSHTSVYAAQTTTPTLPPTSVASAPLGNTSQPQQAPLVPSGSTSSTNVTKYNSKALNKADILRRANERRKQLTDELIKVKTQLWETTIEQGILVHMSREYNNNSNDTR